MIILSDCLSEKDDEGYIKIAKVISERLKQKDPKTKIISLNNVYSEADEIILTNKAFISRKLKKALMGKYVLHLSRGANSLGIAVKLFILSRYCKKLSVIFVQKERMRKSTHFFLKLSGARIICLASNIYEYYKNDLKKNVFYVKTGIDNNKFIPVSKEQQKVLKLKYGFDAEDIILLHVGHLKTGRNIQKLIDLAKYYKVLLVTSSTTMQDEELKKLILNTNNIVLIDTYITNIEELYQISDCYIFPVFDERFSIGIPLSVLEACSCNLPVITTDFGELSNYKKSSDFIFCDFKNINELVELINNVLKNKKGINRKIISEYDWNYSISQIEGLVKKNE